MCFHHLVFSRTSWVFFSSQLRGHFTIFRIGSAIRFLWTKRSVLFLLLMIFIFTNFFFLPTKYHVICEVRLLPFENVVQTFPLTLFIDIVLWFIIGIFPFWNHLAPCFSLWQRWVYFFNEVYLSSCAFSCVCEALQAGRPSFPFGLVSLLCIIVFHFVFKCFVLRRFIYYINYKTCQYYVFSHRIDVTSANRMVLVSMWRWLLGYSKNISKVDTVCNIGIRDVSNEWNVRNSGMQALVKKNKNKIK